MNQPNDDLQKLKATVDAAVRVDASHDRLSKYVTDVVVTQLHEALRSLIARIEEPHIIEDAEVGSPNFVIHYTSVSALISMLRGSADGQGDSSLRLYDSNHLNDPDEGNFFDRNLDSHSRLDDLLPNATYSPHAYIASFIIPFDKDDKGKTTDQKDMSDNLAFWRTYGREGTGCSLALVVPKDRLRKVLYGREAVRRSGELLFPALDEIQICIEPLLTVSSTLRIREQLERTIAGHVDRIRYLYKSDAYDYERECRLVIPEVDTNKCLIKFEYAEPALGLTRVKHYYLHEVLEAKNMFVTGSTITFGPRVPKPENMRYYIETLLARINRDRGPKIRPSGIPYQGSG